MDPMKIRLPDPNQGIFRERIMAEEVVLLLLLLL